MSELKCAPGPWSFKEHGCQILDGRKGSSQSLVATVAINTYLDEGRYNAYLLTAAPDLYEALENMLRQYGSTDVLSERVRAALRKARGEAQ